MSSELLIYNARLVDKNTDAAAGVLRVQDKKIIGVYEDAQSAAAFIPKELRSENRAPAGLPSARRYGQTIFIDAAGCMTAPSFIDMHAHFRDPGQTEKETLASGLAAAASGGFGTLVLMPNTVPVISSSRASMEIRARAAELGGAEVFQSVSITRGFDGSDASHLRDIERAQTPLVTEDGHDVVSAAVLLDAMRICADKNIIVSCHCEDVSFAARAVALRKTILSCADKNDADAFAKIERALRLAENLATMRNIQIAAESGCRAHIAHVSTKEALGFVNQAKKNGVNVTCEVTPHHLALTDDLREFVNPPLRPEADRLTLIQGIIDGTIDVIATDHAPHTAEDKRNGAPGFSGLETAFCAAYETLVRSGRVNLKRLSELMSAAPAAILGLTKKGLLREGFDADIVIANTSAEQVVDPVKFVSKGKYSPFAGKKLHGKIMLTIKSGRIAWTADGIDSAI